jgi:hypothetical protein
MASDFESAEEQAHAILHAQSAAVGRLALPRWYTLSAGVGIGFAVFALASFHPILMAAAVLVIAAGGRLLSFLLSVRTGIRSRELVNEGEPWLQLGFLVTVLMTFFGAIVWDRVTGEIWPGAWLGVVAFMATIAYGEAFNWAVRHRPTV